jgi:glycosyltransferase involved in cell wall biosynthesis
MISIIIPAHEEEKYIGVSLEKILNQKDIVYIDKNTDLKAISTDQTLCEIIVVVSKGKDKTEFIVSRYPKVNLIAGNFCGVSEARNIGAKLSRGDVLLFLDADTLLNDGFLKKLDSLKNKPNSIGTSKLYPDIQSLKPRIFMFCNNIAHIISKTSMALIFCHKEIYNKVKGFDEKMPAGEDLKFIKLALKNHAKFKYIGDISAITSMRRFETAGYLKITLEWTKGYFIKPPSYYDVVR